MGLEKRNRWWRRIPYIAMPNQRTSINGRDQPFSIEVLQDIQLRNADRIALNIFLVIFDPDNTVLIFAATIVLFFIFGFFKKASGTFLGLE